MVKKKKKVVEVSPLQSYQVGKIKENRFWFIKLLLCFAFFGGIIFYLPELNILYEKKVKPLIFGQTVPKNTTDDNTNNVTNNTTDNNTLDNEVDNEISQDIKYYLKDNSEITIKNLKFNAIKYAKKQFSFEVTNLLEELVNIESEELYVELYDSEDNLLNRYAILGSIDGNAKKSYTFNAVSEPSYYMLKKITEEDYTYILLEYDEKNNAKIMCQKGNEKLLYTFNDEKLVKIDHVDQVAKKASDYDEKYTQYNTIYVANHNVSGVTSSFNVQENDLYYKMIVDYNVNAQLQIDSHLYFGKGTSPRVVNFKLESWEYDCN